MADPQHHRRQRIVGLAAAWAGVELALWLLTRFMPAMRGLMRPVYVAVAVAFGLALYHAARRRSGHDRRHGDRRVAP